MSADEARQAAVGVTGEVGIRNRKTKEDFKDGEMMLQNDGMKGEYEISKKREVMRFLVCVEAGPDGV